MKQIHTHELDGLPSPRVTVLDEPGAGGACHLYGIGWGPVDVDVSGSCLVVHFQEGPRGEVGENGVTELALLAILRDRLESFQAGPFASADNARALTAVMEASDALLARHRERLVRGVQGTSAV